MKLLEELPLVGRARQLRHTFVQGADEKHYKVLTFALYDFSAPPEFATHETNVEIVNEKGARFVLDQPLLKRFFNEDEAMAYHQELLEQFDETLNLMAPEKKEHKPVEKKAAPKAEEKKPDAKPAAPAAEKKPAAPPAEKKEAPKTEEKKPEAAPPAAEKKDPPPAGDKPAGS